MMFVRKTLRLHLLGLVTASVLGTATAEAATYYVSTSGSDSKSGSSSAPFRTISKAAAVVRPGDTVNIRGGTYNERPRLSRSGRSDARITFQAHNGETVVINGGARSGQDTLGVSGSWLRLRGLTVENGGRYGVLVTGDDNVLEKMTMRFNRGGGGLRVYQAHRNLIVDSVSHNNWDKMNGGENGDGFNIYGDSNIVRRCKAYDNSDDGFDAWDSTNTTFERSMALDNGYDVNGDGNGFKLSQLSRGRTVAIQNIAYANKKRGFTSNNGGGHSFINNTAVNNEYSFQTTGSDVNFINNLSHKGKIVMKNSPEQKNNSWNLGISDPKFASTSEGSSSFLKLQSTSPAIDKGIVVGLSFTGSRPDLGAKEYGM